MENFQDVRNVCQSWVAVLSMICDLHTKRKILDTCDILETHILKMGALTHDKIMQSKHLNALNYLRKQVIEREIQDSNEVTDQIIREVMGCFEEDYKFPILILLNVGICRDNLLLFTNFTFQEHNTSKYLNNIKKILKCIYQIITSFRIYKKPKSTKIWLSLNQIGTNLPLFLSALKRKNSSVLGYAVGCLVECLNKLEEAHWETSDLLMPCSEFLDLMDVALGFLDEVAERPLQWMHDHDNVIHLKSVIDELLCHSMSTAQVTASMEDRKIILAKSQQILRELERLRDDLAGDDEASVRLNANIVSDTLCALERAVNGAVLRLVLDTNADVEDPVKSLVRECKSVSSQDEARQLSSLDPLIAQFDSYMDKLMQIGLFAVSCTSNLKKSLQLKSCVASFESIEAEMVPSVTNLYLQCTSENKRNIRLLADHWNNEFTKFYQILYSILDPAAYTEVVKSYVKELTNNMEESAVWATVRKICKASRTLISVTKASLDQEPNKKDKEKLSRHYHSIIHETERCEVLQQTIENVPKFEIKQRLSKLEATINSLWEFLAEKIAEIDESTFTSLQEYKSIALPKGEEYYMLCPTDAASKFSKSEELLAPQIARGQMIAKEAVFYTTPKRSTVARAPLHTTPMMRSAAKKTLQASSVRRRCFRGETPKPDVDSNENLHEEFTALMENLTCVDSTFSVSETVLRASSEFKGRQLLELFASLNEGENESSAASMDSVYTPERMRDLLLVEEKLETLK